jgi:glucose/arabinose dehydrogenase
MKMKTIKTKKYLPLVVLATLTALALVLSGTTSSTSAIGNAREINWPELTFEAVATPLNRPVTITHAGDGSGRIFIVEQEGRIRILQEGQLLPDPFLDIQERVRCCGEEGLLGLAFPTGYQEKDYFYVYYTRTDGNNQVSRFHLGPDSNIADPYSEEELLFLHHPNHSNHNGGQIAFGPDGSLYIGTGDGGGAGDPANNAQNLESLMGKILRIDVEAAHLILENPIYLPLLNGGSVISTGAYRIPADNPFLNKPEAQPEIWAYGLRNPWRFSFDPENGDLYIADVGQREMEEINYQPAASGGGENYGWRILEGNLCYNLAVILHNIVEKPSTLTTDITFTTS